ncbi:MAG: hypothetical protein ABMB14_25510 [Myxococcota bacterium]
MLLAVALGCSFQVLFPADTGPVDSGATPIETGAPSQSTSTTTGFDHTVLPPDALCWECHEVDRVPSHFDSPDLRTTYDCGPCHQVTGWSRDPVSHVFRSPHGTYTNLVAVPQEDWIIACADCHPAGTSDAERAGDSCGGCHAGLPTPHFGVVVLSGSVDDCLPCHPTGDTSMPHYGQIGQACADCHETDRPTPSHFAGLDCSSCHLTTGWTDFSAR